MDLVGNVIPFTFSVAVHKRTAEIPALPRSSERRLLIPLSCWWRLQRWTATVAANWGFFSIFSHHLSPNWSAVTMKIFGLSHASCFLGRVILVSSWAAPLRDGMNHALSELSCCLVLWRSYLLFVLFISFWQLVREGKFSFIFFSVHRCWLISSQIDSICFCDQTGGNLRVGCNPELWDQIMNFGYG